MPFLTMIDPIFQNNSMKFLTLMSIYFLRHESILTKFMAVLIIRILIEARLVVFSINLWLQSLLKWYFCSNQVLRVPI
jgi:hypothetical protein